MSRFRRAADALGNLFGRGWAVIRPEPGTTEGAVMIGLVLLAAAFIAAGLIPLALGVPGAVLVAVGLGFSLRRTR